jgi:hypothetical protein
MSVFARTVLTCPAKMMLALRQYTTLECER